MIIGFVDEVIKGKPFLIAGESYGGYLARGLLEHRRKQIKGAVFICPVIFPERQKRTLPEKIHVCRDEVFLQSLDRGDREAFTRENTVLNRKTWVRFREEILAGLRMAEGEFLANVQDNYHFTFPICFFLNQVCFYWESRTPLSVTRMRSNWTGYFHAVLLLYWDGPDIICRSNKRNWLKSI